MRNLRDCVDLGITVVLGGDSELTWDPTRPANAVPGSPDRYETRPVRRPGQISDDGDRRAVEVAVLAWQMLRTGRHPGKWAADGIRDPRDHRVARRFALAGLDLDVVRAELDHVEAAARCPQ